MAEASKEYEERLETYPSYCLAVFPSHMDSAEYVSVLDPQEFFSQIQLTSSKEK